MKELLRVWFNHELIAVYDSDHTATIEGDSELVIRQRGIEVKRFKSNEWHASAHAGDAGDCAGPAGMDCDYCKGVRTQSIPVMVA